MGAMTGRRAGFCAGIGGPGYASPYAGGGFGMGLGRGRGGWRGGGRGLRHWFYATGLPGWARFGAALAPKRPPGAEHEREALESHARALQSELEAIKKRLADLESAAEDA
jgi:hypothetical protein